jgi:hypothetical protein
MDDEGKPVMDPKSGKPVSDGTVGRLIHHTGALFLNHFGQLAQTENDDELTAAVEVLRARAFGRGTAPTQENLTEEQKARAAELDAREQTIKSQESESRKAAETSFNQAITTGIDTYVDAQIDKVLARSDVADGERGKLRDDIRGALYDLIVANVNFQAEQDALMRRPISETTKNLRIGLGKKYASSELLVRVAKDHIAKAGAKIMARQQKQQQAQAARVEASRSEAPGTMRTARPADQQNAKDSVTTVNTSLATKLGRQPTYAESLAELMKAS